MPSSTYNKTGTKAYIKILRHTSLKKGLIDVYSKFQLFKCHRKRDIRVERIFMKNVYFQVPAKFIGHSLGQFQYKIYH